MKRSLVAALVGSFVLLAGCSGSGGGAGAPAPEESYSTPGVALAPESGTATRDQALAPTERKEVVTGQVYITAVDPIEAARDATSVVEEVGGRVDTRSENPETDNSTASSSITARIPADELTSTVDRIEQLGKVTSVSISRDDVTMQYQDLDARIAALQASVDRLKALIAGATNTADLIEAESALSSRQGELDSLTSQRNYLADQVDLSTITIQFTTDDATPSPGPDSFWDGLVAGWHSLVDALGDGVVALGRAIPWLGALAVAAGVVYAVVRVVRRKPTVEQKPEAEAVGETEEN
ncbi:DUF4349 domain-containing protein [Rhodococcoides kyotonense]|uniref:DUF4349 domain-containing protein n=1 Tax=Rhodococcoides kyotonense TaxID=398843 RepID=A0A239NEW6_9NOCA|nr:DUF4349 domain-containing protein [Rhodococcus kyotonensis]SNT53033.1 protein of unknown function [Rhodococcus kyotonensis]